MISLTHRALEDLRAVWMGASSLTVPVTLMSAPENHSNHLVSNNQIYIAADKIISLIGPKGSCAQCHTIRIESYKLMHNSKHHTEK